MSPAEVSRALRLRLAGEVKSDLGALGRRADSVRSLLPTSSTSHEDANAHLRTLALAFEIERFYTAVEATLERLLDGLDGASPRGAHWHTELLRAASVPLTGLRPALISESTAATLRDLLGFRHFARHAYDVDPRAARVEELGAMVVSVAGELAVSLGAIVMHLEA